MEARSPACEQRGSNPLVLSMRKVSKEVLLVDSKAIKQVSYDREKRILLVLFQIGAMYS